MIFSKLLAYISLGTSIFGLVPIIAAQVINPSTLDAAVSDRGRQFTRYSRPATSNVQLTTPSTNSARSPLTVAGAAMAGDGTMTAA